MKKHFLVLFWISCFIFLFLFQFIKIPEVKAQAYRGLVIDEFKFDLGLVQPGDIIHESFTLTHDFQQEDKVVTVYLRSADFKSNNVSGQPIFLGPNDLPFEASMSKWISFEKESITLDHYQQKEIVNFTITIPQNCEAGGKYAAVLLSDIQGQEIINSADEETQLGINKEVGPLVILTVDGDISKNLIGEALYTTDIKGKSRRFFFNPPVNIITVLKNDGNVHTNPRGVFYLYQGNDFQKFEAKFELNPDEGYVLPKSTRQFSATWNDSFITFEPEETDDGKVKIVTKYNWDKLSKIRIGKYKIKLLYNVEAADGTVQTKMMDASFWVFPWQLIVIIILIIIYITWKLRKKEPEEEKKTQKKKTQRKGEK